MMTGARERAYHRLLGGFIALVTYGGFALSAITTEGLDVHTQRALHLSIALGTIVFLLAGSFHILGRALRESRNDTPGGE